MAKYIDFKASIANGLNPQDLLNYAKQNNIELRGLDEPSSTETQQPQQYDPQIEAQIAKVPRDKQENMRAVADALDKEGILTPNTLAYTLGTIQHETAGTFSPIEEYGGREQARSLGYDGGENYYGRGYIQLTGQGNYEALGNRIGVPDLAQHPEKALDPAISAKITAAFIKDRGVADLANKGDFIGARQPINGTDQVEKIAEYTQSYLDTPQPTIPNPTEHIPSPSTPNPTPSPIIPPTPNPTPEQQVREMKPAPDVVTPFKNPVQSQYVGENPGYYTATGGHTGVDEYNSDLDPTTRNMIGGRAFTFNQPSGYGNAAVIVGGNPQETAQMSPEEIVRIHKEVQEKGPYASSAQDFNIPGRDIAIQAHLNDFGNIRNGEPIATGAARMQMGGTGGVAPHGHTEIKTREGNLVDPILFYQEKTGQKYPLNPEKGTYNENEIRNILANYGKAWQRR